MSSKDKTSPRKTNSLFKVSILIIIALLVALIISGIQIANLSSQLSDSESEFGMTSIKIYELESKRDICKYYVEKSQDSLKEVRPEIQAAKGSSKKVDMGFLDMTLADNIYERSSILHAQESEVKTLYSALSQMDASIIYILDDLENCL